MITAKKAKEKIIKSISKRKYINKCKEAINKAIANYQFECNVKIDEYDDIDVDIYTTTICILKYFGYYGYDGFIRECTGKTASIVIRWSDN